MSFPLVAACTIADNANIGSSVRQDLINSISAEIVARFNSDKTDVLSSKKTKQ